MPSRKGKKRMRKELTPQERVYAIYGKHNAEQCWANNYAFALEAHARLSDCPNSKSAIEGIRLAWESMTNWAEMHAEWVALLS